MRLVVLDTETTGLEPERGHRIIEIGCVEVLNRRVTGRHFHRYVNPQRDIDHGAQAVHGIDRARLEQAPVFADIADELLAFLDGAELVIHNASFDLAFLDLEFERLAADRGSGAVAERFSAGCKVIDSLALARELHPGQRNNLDALCKRYGIDCSKREWHGALLDAQLLAEVYLAMTGGQSALALGQDARAPAHPPARLLAGEAAVYEERLLSERPSGLVIVAARAEESVAHEAFLSLIDAAAGRPAIWRSVPGPATG
ncbi:MAG: DNA polymerase III subunit epsilon [Gammaproteobacteria bacterium]|nr:DNA polymerase III subunit epsilon [Gammaproteobacteria bacterium]